MKEEMEEDPAGSTSEGRGSRLKNVTDWGTIICEQLRGPRQGRAGIEHAWGGGG